MIHVPVYASKKLQAIPQVLQVSQEENYLFRTQASGYQIYRCEASDNQYYWVLKAPDAALYGDNGNLFGTHYTGPTWQASDGSYVVGKPEAKVNAPNNIHAVAWLKVKVVSRGGQGIFDQVNYINRVNTQGGQPPKESCNKNYLGDEYRARYSAEYYFYGDS